MNGWSALRDSLSNGSAHESQNADNAFFILAKLAHLERYLTIVPLSKPQPPTVAGPLASTDIVAAEILAWMDWVRKATWRKGNLT